MDKPAAGKQTSGFMKSRSGTRPYRVETLLKREPSKKPSEVLNPLSSAEKKYAKAMVQDEGGGEFVKKGEADLKNQCFFRSATMAALNPELRLFKGQHSGQSAGDTGHFYLQDPAGKVIDPTASQFKTGRLVDRGYEVSVAKNLDYVISDPLFRTMSKTDQTAIRSLQKKGEAAEGRDAVRHVLITGLPAAGKTTEGKRLSKETGMPLISLDGLPKSYQGPGKWVRTDGARRLMSELDEPHIIEGTQLLGLRPDEIKGHDFHVLEQPKNVIIDRLVDRGWKDDQGKLHKGESQRGAAGKFYYEHERWLKNPMKKTAAVDLVHLQGEEAQKFGQQYPDAKVRQRDVIAAVKGGKYIGGIAVKPGPDDFTKKIFGEVAPNRPSSGHVSYLHVDDDQRKQGIGRALLNEALKGRPNLTLGTDNRGVNTDESAVRLYEKAGFEPLKKETRSTYWMKKEGENLLPRPNEFAPGIRKERRIEPIPGVKESGPNTAWTASLSKHPAARRGDHLDLRLVDEKGRAHSWALKAIPEPGKSTYAAQMPTHSGKYAKKTKPFTIPLGVYGGTRPGAQVESVYVQPAEVISANSNRVHILRHHGQETEELVMRRLSAPQLPGSRPQAPLWALHNATRTRETKDGGLLPDSKPKYREQTVDVVDLGDTSTIMTPKLDGAHVLVQFPKSGKMQRVFSYRPTERNGGLIEHTFKFPGFQNRKTPEGLQGTVIRAEAWGTGPDGKAIPASELGGLLNSSVPRSRRDQESRGVTLRLTGHDVIRHGGMDYSAKGFEDKLRVLEKVRKQTKGTVEAPITARTPEEKMKLFESIKSGVFPDTKEGVVLHSMLPAVPPTKVKIKQDDDVYVRGVYNKSSKDSAAGFTYSLDPTGPIVGRVGTGLSSQMRREMSEAPEKFVGRVAKVQSAGRHQPRGGEPGALVGSPAFKEWHIDKTPPKLLKESAVRISVPLGLGFISAGTAATLQYKKKQKELQELKDRSPIQRTGAVLANRLRQDVRGTTGGFSEQRVGAAMAARLRDEIRNTVRGDFARRNPGLSKKGSEFEKNLDPMNYLPFDSKYMQVALDIAETRPTVKLLGRTVRGVRSQAGNIKEFTKDRAGDLQRFVKERKTN